MTFNQLNGKHAKVLNIILTQTEFEFESKLRVKPYWIEDIRQRLGQHVVYELLEIKHADFITYH